MSEQSLRNLSFYCIYVRNHTESGTLQGVIDDLPRIAGMGIDFVWLLPIHPIGETNRKGALGSPYSVSNFRQINPEHGSMDDFHCLVSEVHRQGMRLMLDIVFRHTSHDCPWVKEHPEWYLRDEMGKPTTVVPEWSDILDLKFDGNEETLWSELIDILKYWCAKGVDGFRMDAASSVPMQFWRQARCEVSNAYSHCLWLAESTLLFGIEQDRAEKRHVNTDSSLYEAFDLCYDYDVYGAWCAVLADAIPIKSYLELVRLQTAIYPHDFIKLRFVENHDSDRIAHVFRDNRFKALAWTAFMAFNKGCFLVHAGQETEQTKTSSLFDKDRVDCKGVHPLQEFTHRLIQIKKHSIIESNDAKFTLTDHSPCIVAVWELEAAREGLIGFFNVAQNSTNQQLVQIDNLPDGKYENVLHDLGIEDIPKAESTTVTVHNEGKVRVPPVAAILHYSGFVLRPRIFYSELFDFDYRGM